MSTALVQGGRSETNQRQGRGGKMDEYPDEAKFQALTYYVLAGRNAAEAERQIKAAHGEGPSGRTIWKWSGENPDLVERLQQELVPRISSRAAAASEAIVIQIDALAEDLLSRLRTGLEDLKPREAAGILKDLSIVKGINTEKAQLLRNRPTQIVEHRDVVAAIDKLERMGVLSPSEARSHTIAAAGGTPQTVAVSSGVQESAAERAIARRSTGKEPVHAASKPAGQS